MFGSGKIAIDFASTNTAVAVAGSEGVRILHLSDLGREQLSAHPTLIPTAVHYPAIPRRFRLPRRTRPRIGQQALHASMMTDGPVRQKAARTLGHIGEARAIPMLRRLSNRKSDDTVILRYRKLLAQIEAATESIKDLPLPSHPTQTSLPLPASEPAYKNETLPIPAANGTECRSVRRGLFQFRQRN